MELNNKYTEHFTKEERTDLEFLLFVIWRDLIINSYLTNNPNDSELTWELTYLGKLQPLVLKLSKLGLIEEDYDRENTRWKLVYPLYIDIQLADIKDDFIENCRSFFKKSYSGFSGRAGTKSSVRLGIEYYLTLNPSHRKNLIQVFKYRVDSMPDFVPNILNFINSNQDPVWEGKDLKAFYEEWLENGTVNTGGFDV